MCIPKSNHKKLIDECYPPGKMLAGIGPDYKPNGNELSRLCHYANRKPAKLTKVGNKLQLRAASESKGVTGVGQSSDKAKGALMITLALTKELIIECHRELNYFTNAAAAVIQSALQAAGRGGANGSRDLEISSRAASTFYAFSVHIDASTASTDADTRRAYSNLLIQFSRLGRERLIDGDLETKSRLVGLGAFAGAISSDAFFNSSYSDQLSYVLPALLDNIDASAFLNDPQSLLEEAKKVAETGSASNKEYSAKRRHTAMRSIPSFAFDSEKGISYRDVASAAMGNLHSILHYGDASQVQIFVQVFIEYLNGRHGTTRQWENKDWCCWITQSLCTWTAVQYRFIILTQLVEHLVEESEGPPESKHYTLIAMITSLLGGELSMIGLSTSDTANNLLGYAVRRVYFAKGDPLVGPLVFCISALSKHIYYADQLNDMAEEICARIAALEIPEEKGGVGGGGVVVSTYMEKDAARESIRMLLACLVGLMKTSHKSSGEVQDEKTIEDNQSKEYSHAGTRNRISTSVFHQTASLLTSPDYLIRQAYQETLLTFFSNEVSPNSIESNDPLSDSLGSKLSVEATGFTHSFSAGLYVMALSKVFYAPSTVKESPLEALPIIDRSNKDEGRALQSDDPTSCALPVDYSAVIKVLEVMYERIPIASLLGTVPALISINAASTRLPSHRKEAVQSLLSRALSRIGSIWGVSQLTYSASSEYLPDFPSPQGSRPLLFSESADTDSSSSSPALSTGSVIDNLSGSAKVQAATGLDAKALKAWFGRDWSVQMAVDDSFIGASPFTLGDDEAHSSSRFASMTERTPRTTTDAGLAQEEEQDAVGVDDFRQALGTRNYNSANVNGQLYNGPSSNSNVEKKSRRASRKISQGGQINGAGIGGVFDSLKVGMKDEESTAKVASPPRVA